MGIEDHSGEAGKGSLPPGMSFVSELRNDDDADGKNKLIRFINFFVLNPKLRGTILSFLKLNT